MAVPILTKKHLQVFSGLNSDIMTRNNKKYLSYLGNKLNDRQTGTQYFRNVTLFNTFFADQNDISIVSVMEDSATLNEEMSLISNLAFMWKFSSNPYPSKQAKEIIFSKKDSSTQLPDIRYSKNIISSAPSRKHLAMILDSKLNYNHDKAIYIYS